MVGSVVTSPPIELDAVCASYDDHREILRDLSLTLESGERLGLTGPNGSGKTTLLRLIVGLIRPTSGTLRVLGEEVNSEAQFASVRRTVGLLFQDSDDQLFCPTVHEDVAFGPFNLGLSHAEVHAVVNETLDLLGLGDLEQRITYQLSVGQRRLVALATILAMKPKVLLLDEPTAGLDETHEARLVEILQGLPQEMIIVSHNTPFLEEVATRVQRLGA